MQINKCLLILKKKNTEAKAIPKFAQNPHFNSHAGLLLNVKYLSNEQVNLIFHTIQIVTSLLTNNNIYVF